VVAASRGADDIPMNAKKRSPLSADLFGSVCYTFQHGNFRKLYGDLTRVDARLDICSASAFATRVLNGLKRSSVASVENPASSPRLNLIFQQQVCQQSQIPQFTIPLENTETNDIIFSKLLHT
jgi:hypothetical protein